MKTISVVNLKGGVAKTFTVVNMAYELYRRGYKVLLLDNDKQGNLSKAYKKYCAEEVAPISKLLSGKWKEAGELIRQTDYEGIDIVSANMSLMGAMWNLTVDETENQIERYKKLKRVAENNYDYCIIDNPPDIGIHVVNALVAADEVIVPVKIDEWALEGLDILEDQIKDVRQFNPSLYIKGILVTAYQNTDGEEAGEEWLARKMKKEVGAGVYGKDFLLWRIRYSRKVAESTFLHEPIYEYSPCCGAAQDYKKFVTQYTGKER